MLWEGENCLNVIGREKLAGIGQNNNDSEKRLDPCCTPEDGLPHSWGSMHVYYHNIQTFSPLKPLGQSKPNFI